MSLEFFWRLPTYGDGRSAAGDKNNRGDWQRLGPRNIAPRRGHEEDFGYVDYMAQIAKAVELSGFKGILVPTGRMSEEPWATTAALARETRTLHFMVAFQPLFLHPAYCAQMAASLQRICRDRLEINVITGGTPKEQLAYGDSLSHDDRYARTGEFLDVFRGVWGGEPFNHQGRFWSIENGGLKAPLKNARQPDIYFSGYSDPALDVAARHSDVYLMWAEAPASHRDQIAKVRERAAAKGRKTRFGLRIDLIARETEAEARAEAKRIYDNIDDATVALTFNVGAFDSVGARRQVAFHKGQRSSFDDLFVYPNLWAGMGLARPGPACALVGSHEQVAERLREYVDEGFDSFILGGSPHLEEAFRTGEEILPLVRGDAAAGSEEPPLRGIASAG